MTFCKSSGRKNKPRRRKGSLRTSALHKQLSWKYSLLLLLLHASSSDLSVYGQLKNLYFKLTKTHFLLHCCCKDFKAPRITSVCYHSSNKTTVCQDTQWNWLHPIVAYLTAWRWQAQENQHHCQKWLAICPTSAHVRLSTFQKEQFLHIAKKKLV